MLSAPQNSSSGSAIAASHAQVLARIAAAAQAAGRDVRSITVLAVSKGQPAARLLQAMDAGLGQFGENYLAEALPKIQALRERAPVWHFIGRVQANKTRPIAEHFDWVHGVDRLHVAGRLAEQRPHYAPPLNVCLQVNIAGEAAKGGMAPHEAPEALAAVARLPRLRLRGLMCMLPHEADVTTQHLLFGQMRQLLETANAAGLGLDTLSMGMSGDLETAVAQGATMLRIGTALFGPREPL
ncbi:MAG: YggS family pyridoxal phosphate-dependent enzyme [Steroidobacteraceae bacterium]